MVNYLFEGVRSKGYVCDRNIAVFPTYHHRPYPCQVL